MSFLDDERAFELHELRTIALNNVQEIDAALRQMRPTQRLSSIQRRLLNRDRDIVLDKKEKALKEYRAARDALLHYRRELQEAAMDVERDLTDPEDLIRELRRLAIAAGAYKIEGGQELLNAASTWLGPRAIIGGSNG